MKRIATLMASMAILVAPGTALAQESSTCQAYNPELCTTVNDGSTTTDATLPFTGLDVGLLAIGGGGLLGAGLAVRRLSGRLD
jgi:hypothetical protein